MNFKEKKTQFKINLSIIVIILSYLQVAVSLKNKQNNDKSFQLNQTINSTSILPPTLKIIIQHNLLEKYRDQILPQFEDDIEKKLQAIEIPEFNSSKHELFFNTSIAISDIKIQSFSFDPASVYVEFLKNFSNVANGIALSINDFEIHISADCNYRLGIFNTDGKIAASIKKAQIHSFLEIDIVNQQLEVKVVDIEIKLNNFDVSIEGSFFLKVVRWFVDLFQGSVKKHIQQTIIDDKSIINEEIKKILKVPKIINFKNQNFALSFSLININFYANYFELDVIAYFFNSQKPEQIPPIADPVQMNFSFNSNNTNSTSNYTLNSSNLMSTILFSQYFIQSFLYAAYDSDSLIFKFEENLTKFNIQLADNNSMAAIYIKSLNMPQINITNDNLYLTIKSQIYIYIGDQLFLNCSIDANALLDHNPDTQQLQIEQVQILSVKLNKTSWDFLNAESIKFLTEFAVDKQINALNDKLNYIHINNKYIPFKAIQPTIFTRNGYFELNVYSEDVVQQGQKYSKRYKKLLQSSIHKKMSKQFKLLKELEEL